MTASRPTESLPGRQVALVDLLDRLLSGGVVLSGDLVLSIADIDLVRISLRALIVSVDSEADPLAPPDREGTVNAPPDRERTVNAPPDRERTVSAPPDRERM
ncbi:gas vesicle protein [Streptomyces bikiniensis]|uniref:gas vesicle protein n=1 Tax=Streptomyces bikiniensis TaxID=1896 RepID=UPI000996719E|nr:gas vesicle protein [Streptomyces bikiniensis]